MARDRVELNATNLRGLAHPIRVKLLGALRLDGPSTATRLASRLGLSSAATSYHLRQLAAYGFVVEDETAERAHGKEASQLYKNQCHEFWFTYPWADLGG
jgi:predicted transcriptional regulator